MKHPMNRLLAIILGAFVLGPAHGAVIDFTFSYTFQSGEILSGVARGNLQGDNDTIIVTDLLQSSYSGDPSLVFPTGLFDNTETPEVEANIVYLSGADPVNFGTTSPLVTSGPTWIVGFPLSSTIIAAVAIGPGMAIELEGLGIPGVIPSTWQIAVVPAPPAVLLLATGLAGVGLRAWRRRRASAS